MREILFRAKRVDNGEWVEGYYCRCVEAKGMKTSKSAIQETDENGLYFREVDPTTLGQFTGLTDKNGKKIFEGDIVKMDGWWYAAGPAGYSNNLTVVLYDEEYCGFTPMCDYDCDCGVYHPANECEVIGNIHDNPELLEGNDG